jgi:polyisoprenoid-binding protein YceI
MKTVRLIQTMIASSVFATAAFASPTTYVIDNSHTYPRFEYTHLGFSNQVHRFNKTTGKIVLDRVAKTGSVDVTVDTKSVDTGHAGFNEHIQAEGFLETAKFPTMMFKSSSLKFEGDKLTSVDGTLTIKDVSKPITLAVTGFSCGPHPFNKKEVCGANAAAKIKRSEFNAGKYAPAVSDEMTLTISIEAVKE